MPLLKENISTTMRVERLTAFNLVDVEQLFTAVYGRKPAAGYFMHKYHTAWCGISFMGFIAYNEKGIAVAFCGAIPSFIYHENKKVKAAQSVDVMTHPQYRNKGIFVVLSKMIFDLCRQQGIALMYGFPNQNSLHSMVHKLHWQWLTNMDCFIIPVQQMHLFKKMITWPVIKSLYKKYRNYILQPYRSSTATITNSVWADGFAGTERSADWMQYKKKPAHIFVTVDGASAWASCTQHFMLGDMYGADADRFLPLIDQLKVVARKAGYHQIQFHCCPGTHLHQLFAQHFIAQPSYPVMIQDFGSTIDTAQLQFTFADLDIF